MYFLVKKTIAMILLWHIEMGETNRLSELNSVSSWKRCRHILEVGIGAFFRSYPQILGVTTFLMYYDVNKLVPAIFFKKFQN